MVACERDCRAGSCVKCNAPCKRCFCSCNGPPGTRKRGRPPKAMSSQNDTVAKEPRRNNPVRYAAEDARERVKK